MKEYKKMTIEEYSNINKNVGVIIGQCIEYYNFIQKLNNDKAFLKERIDTLKKTQIKQLNIIQKQDNKLDKIKSFVKAQAEIIEKQPSKDLEVDSYFISILGSILYLIESESE